MKKLLVAAVTSTLLATSAAWGQDAMDYYTRGVNSSLAKHKIKYFTRALQLDPYLADAYAKRATLYYFQDHFEESIQDYLRVIQLDPVRVKAYQMLSLVQLKSGNLHEAIASASRAIELDPKGATAYSQRAEAHRLRGMLDEGIRDATTAIRLRGDQRTTADAYATRAKIYEQLGRSDLSRDDFLKSFELDPRYAVLRYFTQTASLENTRRIGLFGIIGILFVMIFKMALPKPRK
ncbi:MAG: tetratricopeptide repeat protein [Syntrophobacteria bacterium]